MSPFEHLFYKITRPGFIVLYLVVIIIAYFYVDKNLAEYLSARNFSDNVPFLKSFTRLGNNYLYIPLFLIAALYFRWVKIKPLVEQRFWFLWLCVMLPTVTCFVLKVLCGRARPDMWLDARYYGFYGLQTKGTFWSFPSGHTTTVMGVILGLSIIFPRWFKTLITLGILVALSRILLTRHYLTDVLAAAWLAVIEIGLLVYYLKHKGWLTSAWKHSISWSKSNVLSGEVL